LPAIKVAPSTHAASMGLSSFIACFSCMMTEGVHEPTGQGQTPPLFV
jgi:hypothetical protein